MESNLSKIELYFVIRWIQSKLVYTRFLAIETCLCVSLNLFMKFLYTALTLALSDLNRKEMKEF